MKIALVKGLDNVFKIAYDSDYEKCKKLKVGDIHFFDVVKERNIKFHRKFFALMNMVYQNQEGYNNLEDLRHDLTIEAGFFTRRTNLDGDEVKKPKSISFAKMDDLEFSEFYEAFIKVIVKFFGYDRQDIIDHLEQYF